MNPRPLKKAAGDWWAVLVITHRYLGIAMSVPMLVWFLSGIVMMYVHYPHISEKERLRTLEPISWQACCRFGENVIGEHAQVLLAEVENRAGEPVLRIRSADDLDTVVDLVRGTPIQIDADRARAIALAAAQRIIGRPSPLIDADQIDGDQWTIGLAAAAPLSLPTPLSQLASNTAAPSVPPPASNTGSPPAASTTPIRPPNDQDLIQDALQRYRRAYGRLNVQSAEAVYPSVNRVALARAFDSLESQAITFDMCDVEVSGSMARAICHGTTRYVPKVGSRYPRTEPLVWSFELRKADGGDWTIYYAKASR